MNELEDLIASARAAAERAGATDVETGRLEGLVEQGRARVSARAGETSLHHAGYLVGHLIRWLHEHGEPLDPTTLLAASVYGASIADDGGQQQLRKPDRPMTAHSYAAIRTESKVGSALDPARERMLFGWLLEQSGVPPTAQLLAKLDRLRARRLERTGRPIG